MNRCGFMLIFDRRATQPESWRSVCTPSRIRMCVKPISCQWSAYSGRAEGDGLLLAAEQAIQ